MKVSIKTLNGELFQIEVELSDQVREIKRKVQDSRPTLVQDRQKLIHSGKVLKDEQTVAELGLAESDFIVCMVSKEITKKPVADTQNSQTTSKVEPVAPTENKTSTNFPNVQTESSVVNESLVALKNMGFPESDCKAALEAAMGNPDLAYEFLLTGIPANSSPNLQQNQSSLGIEQLKQHPQFNTLKRVVQQNPAALSQVLDLIGQQNPSLLAAIHANNDAFLAMMNEPIVENDTVSTDIPTSHPDHGQMIQFLNALPVEQRAMFAQSMGMTADQLQGFINMMSSMPTAELNNIFNNVQSGEEENDPPGVIRLTHEEMAAVNRLVALGFSQQQAAQAYLACDKNESLAANLLLEGGWGEDDNDFDGGHEDNFR